MSAIQLADKINSFLEVTCDDISGVWTNNPKTGIRVTNLDHAKKHLDEYRLIRTRKDQRSALSVQDWVYRAPGKNVFYYIQSIEQA